MIYLRLKKVMGKLLTGVLLVALLFIGGWHYWAIQKTRHRPIPEPPSQIIEAVRVPILTYHSVRPYYPNEIAVIKRFDVEPDVFEQQLDYLQQQGYTTISFRDLIDHFKTGKPLPLKPVILGFDDGWENQYEYALPILQKKKMTATFFIFTNAIGRKHYMSWDQIKALDTEGMVIGSHTKFHPYLFKMIDHAALWKEIAESKDIIESHIKKPVYVLAYPFGLYNDQNVAVVKEAGYEAARAEDTRGWMHTKDDLFTLKSIQAATTLEAFIRNMNQ